EFRRGNVFRCLKESLSSSPAKAGDPVLRSRCWREQTIAGGYWMPMAKQLLCQTFAGHDNGEASEAHHLTKPFVCPPRQFGYTSPASRRSGAPDRCPKTPP